MRTADSPSWRPFTSSHLLTSHTTQNYTIWGQFIYEVEFHNQKNLTTKKVPIINRKNNRPGIFQPLNMSKAYCFSSSVNNLEQVYPISTFFETVWTILNISKHDGHLGKGFYNSFDQLKLSSSHFAMWLIIKTLYRHTKNKA